MQRAQALVQLRVVQLQRAQARAQLRVVQLQRVLEALVEPRVQVVRRVLVVQLALRRERRRPQVPLARFRPQ